jgi:hypothetical protein
MPDDGVAKPFNTPDNPRVGARMKAAGAAAGIDFTGKTDHATPTPDSTAPLSQPSLHRRFPGS